MSAEDIRKSIVAAMMSRAKDSKVHVHMVNGEEITLSPKAFPLPSPLEEDSVMDIADGDKGRLIMLNLDHVTFMECYAPKKGELSNVQNLVNEVSKDVDAEDASKIDELVKMLFGDDE